MTSALRTFRELMSSEIPVKACAASRDMPVSESRAYLICPFQNSTNNNIGEGICPAGTLTLFRNDSATCALNYKY